MVIEKFTPEDGDQVLRDKVKVTKEEDMEEAGDLGEEISELLQAEREAAEQASPGEPETEAGNNNNSVHVVRNTPSDAGKDDNQMSGEEDGK